MGVVLFVLIPKHVLLKQHTSIIWHVCYMYFFFKQVPIYMYVANYGDRIDLLHGFVGNT